jgi:predicted DCC family thiol-disulfide oxidoreductase YuxK
MNAGDRNREETGPVILFDGVCNLCNASVRFILKYEKSRRYRFAPLQGTFASAFRHRYALPEDADSVVLIEKDRIFTASTAALRIARHLKAPWNWVVIFKILPVSFRDAVYHWIARNRYRWFGKRETCEIPSPEIAHRFLD